VQELTWQETRAVRVGKASSAGSTYELLQEQQDGAFEILLESWEGRCA
jgi:hypothetical protein